MKYDWLRSASSASAMAAALVLATVLLAAPLQRAQAASPRQHTAVTVHGRNQHPVKVLGQPAHAVKPIGAGRSSR